MTTTRKPGAGRPRLLTRERIVEAALRLGLEEFTMKGVAAELGTTIATLYSYVRDRDQLFRMAVDEVMARMPLPVDRDQHWSIYLREFTDAIANAMIGDLHVLDRLIHWGIGMETEIKLGEIFLQAMVKRAFAPEEARRILRLVGATAFGVAVRTHSTQARIHRSGSIARAQEEAMARYGVDELPIMRSIAEDFFEGGPSLLHAMIEPLIEQIARQRGEALPGLAP